MPHVVDEERRGPSVEIADYTITPVCRVRISASRFGTYVVLTGSLTPSAVIVKSGEKELIFLVPEVSPDSSG